MKYSKHIVAAAFAASMVTATAYAQEEENEASHPHEKVKMEDLPAPVKATLQREAQGKTIESIAKETEHGATSYEAELVSNGKGQTIEISESGKVTERHAAHEEKGENEPGETNH